MLLKINAVRRFKVGRFIFENHLLKLHSDEEEKEFRNLFEQLPRRFQSQIVEVNEAAMQALTRPVEIRRGPVTANDLPVKQVAAANVTSESDDRSSLGGSSSSSSNSSSMSEIAKPRTTTGK